MTSRSRNRASLYLGSTVLALAACFAPAPQRIPRQAQADLGPGDPPAVEPAVREPVVAAAPASESSTVEPAHSGPVRPAPPPTPRSPAVPAQIAAPHVAAPRAEPASAARAPAAQVKPDAVKPKSDGVELANAKRVQPSPYYVLERGEGRQDVWFPRDEELIFDVKISLGVLGDAKVGDVTITSKVEPFHPEGLLATAPPDDGGLEQAVVSAHASGNYAVYNADQVISTRILPQAWPHLLHRNVQTGTENRQRELMIGTRDGESTSTHRSDGHCKGCTDRAHFLKPNWIWQDEYHCTGCRRAEHRVWKPYEDKDVPDGTLDMVTAVMLARTMVQQGKPSASFQLIDKEKLWDVELSRGRKERRTIRAGTFDCVEVVLKTSRAVTEKRKEGDFEGLFGLHGSISIWMHPESGVPIAVTGTVPAGPLNLDVAIELAKYHGTAETFREVVAK
jgi:hypothetical protein